MTKQDLLRALEPFEDDIFVAVRLKTSDGSFFDLAIDMPEYIAADEDEDAYIAFRLQQGVYP